MKINEQLFFVVPLLRDDGSVYAHVHSLPISVSAYDVHFNLLIRAYQAMTESGYLAFRSARRFVRAAAASLSSQEDADAFAMPLLSEVERLSTVSMAHGAQWDVLPLRQAIEKGMLEDGDADEVLNAALFFTVAWHVPTRTVRGHLLAIGSKLWDARTTSSGPMAPTAGGTISNAAETLRPAAVPSVTVVMPARRAS